MTVPNYRWHRHFLALALQHARMSKDPRTKVGAIIVGPDREVLSAGYNGFPRGIRDDDRLTIKEDKLKIIVHAEMNAVLAAARNGIKIKDTIMYICATDEIGQIYGGPPCTRCAVECIQAGIIKVIYYPYKEGGSWKGDLMTSAKLLDEAGVLRQEVPYAGPEPNLQEMYRPQILGNIRRAMFYYPLSAELFDYGASG